MSATGGGVSKMNTFSPIEESVIRLIDLHRAVEGTSDTRSFGDSILQLPPHNEDDPIPLDNDDDPEAENVDVNIVYTHSTPRPSSRTRLKNSLIAEQLELQKQFHENIAKKLDSITYAVNDTNKALKQMVRLKEKSYDLKKREIELKKSEIELKKSEIELKKSEIVLRESGMKLKKTSNLDKQKMKLQHLEIKKQKLDMETAKL